MDSITLDDFYMSSRQWTRIETDILARVLNPLPYKDVTATIEDAIKDLEKEDADTIRTKIRLSLQNSKPPKDHLSKDERKLWKNCNLIHQLKF